MARENSNQHLKILILSTRPKHYSGNLGGDLYEALKRGGHEVNYFTCPSYENSDIKIYGETEHKNRDSIKFYIKNNFLFQNIYRIFKNIYFKIYPSKIKGFSSNGFQIHYPFENNPEYPTQKIIDSIDKDFDLIITLYWHHFINSSSLKQIYDQLKCPIIILPVDMGPMTGGCYYFNNCINYMNECLNCPAEGMLPKGQCHKNYQIKKRNYDSINCAWASNSWMNQFAKRSNLFDKNLIEIGSFILDETIYTPNFCDENRMSLDIDPQKIVLLARSSPEPRKGAQYIIYALKKLCESLPAGEKEKLLIITVGDDNISESLTRLGINAKSYGYVDKTTLIKLYQISHFFLSASTDDAGPSMVNHSISCGTPVICFNNGCAVDVIEDGVSGFKTNEISTEAYYDILKKAYSYISNNKYNDLRATTRQKSLKFSSFLSTEQNLIRIYNKLRKKQNNA